jgi:hypothetical protein
MSTDQRYDNTNAILNSFQKESDRGAGTFIGCSTSLALFLATVARSKTVMMRDLECYVAVASFLTLHHALIANAVVSLLRKKKPNSNDEARRRGRSSKNHQSREAA